MSTNNNGPGTPSKRKPRSVVFAEAPRVLKKNLSDNPYEYFTTDKVTRNINGMRSDTADLSPRQIAWLHKIKNLDAITQNDKITREEGLATSEALGVAQQEFVKDFERRPEAWTTDSTFIKEAENLQRYYKRQRPGEELDIMPFYKDDSGKVLDRLRRVGPDENVYLFGHHGTKYGGIENETWKNWLGRTDYKACYLGSCNADDLVNENPQSLAQTSFKDLPDFHYRPFSAWLGVNPNGKTLDDAMFSRQINENNNTHYVGKLNPGRDQGPRASHTVSNPRTATPNPMLNMKKPFKYMDNVPGVMARGGQHDPSSGWGNDQYDFDMWGNFNTAPGQSTRTERDYTLQSMTRPWQKTLGRISSLGNDPLLGAMPNTGIMGQLKTMAGLASGLSGAALGWSKPFTAQRRDLVKNQGEDQWQNLDDVRRQHFNAPAALPPLDMRRYPGLNFSSDGQPQVPWNQPSPQRQALDPVWQPPRAPQAPFAGQTNYGLPQPAPFDWSKLFGEGGQADMPHMAPGGQFSWQPDPYGQMAAVGAVGGLAMAAGSISDRRDERENQHRQRNLGMSDNAFMPVIPVNPFGDFTTNVGMGPAFRPDANIGHYAEGGEYEMSDDELAQFMAQGGEVEYLD